MGTISELPKLDRPREKAIRYGVASLSDTELLALLIGSGYRENNALIVASRLISTYHGLNQLGKVSVEELKTNKGIKEARSIIISAIFELHNRLNIKEKENDEGVVDADYLYSKYKQTLLRTNQENLLIVILNRYKKIIYEKTLYIGTENNVIFSYKDIWSELYTHRGKYFYLIHNHPNDKCEPSQKDVMLTEELYIESYRINIPLIDHLIIGEDGYYSFKERKKSKTILS